MLTPQEQVTLEALIDRHTLGGVLDAVAEICYAKGEHVMQTWHDEPLMRTWMLVGERLADVRTEDL